LFGAWLDGIPQNLMNQILLGAAALCWEIWLNRNDMVFNNVKSNTFMQIIFRTTYWIHTWSQLHKVEEAREMLKKGCILLKTVIMEIFVKFG
jgi:hypothetical protein